MRLIVTEIVTYRHQNIFRYDNAHSEMTYRHKFGEKKARENKSYANAL